MALKIVGIFIVVYMIFMAVFLAPLEEENDDE